ncbi:hypothetical protein Q8A73_021163 [Channa argus]|nr:hypothetical protein Q8A73_021163 [Channa argus]
MGSTTRDLCSVAADKMCRGFSSEETPSGADRERSRTVAQLSSHVLHWIRWSHHPGPPHFPTWFMNEQPPGSRDQPTSSATTNHWLSSSQNVFTVHSVLHCGQGALAALWTSRKLAASTPCCSAFGGELRANQCMLTKGEEHSESQLFPQAMGNEEVGETEGDNADRTRGKGVDNMFPLLLYTERNNMITAALACSRYNRDSSSLHCTNGTELKLIAVNLQC